MTAIVFALALYLLLVLLFCVGAIRK
jgi:hypothetical protein